MAPLYLFFHDVAKKKYLFFWVFLSGISELSHQLSPELTSALPEFFQFKANIY